MPSIRGEDRIDRVPMKIMVCHGDDGYQDDCDLITIMHDGQSRVSVNLNLFCSVPCMSAN